MCEESVCNSSWLYVLQSNPLRRTRTPVRCEMSIESSKSLLGLLAALLITSLLVSCGASDRMLEVDTGGADAEATDVTQDDTTANDAAPDDVVADDISPNDVQERDGAPDDAVLEDTPAADVPNDADEPDVERPDADEPDVERPDADEPDAFVPTISVPIREALLVYARNGFQADTDEEALTPYLAYVDQEGEVIGSYLFDTFVFLDIDLITTERPTVERWRHFLDAFFEVAPNPPVARPEVTQRGTSQGALLSADGEAVAQTNIPVTGGGSLAWEVFTRTSTPVTGREALIGVVVRDAQDTPITTGVSGLTWSDYLSQWYHYLPSRTRWQRHRGTFTLPANAASVDVQIRQFNAPGEQIWVDRVQLVAGSQTMPFPEIVAAGYETLVRDGDFSSGAPWGGFASGDGLERGLWVRENNQGVGQGPIAVSGASTYTLSASLRTDQPSSAHEALLGVRVFDHAGSEITSNVGGMGHSTYTRPPMFYAYAEATADWSTSRVTLTLPAQAASLEIYLMSWTDGDVWFDEVQLVSGSTALSGSELSASGYETLLADGSAEVWETSAWWLPASRPLPSGRGLLPALADVASTLEDPRKRNVILGLPVGVGFETQSDFGVVNGRRLDLRNETDQRTALAWFIDEATSRWSATGPPSLDLIGFYWMHESRNQTPALAAFAQGQAASHNLLLTGSPYRMFLGGSHCFGSSFSPEFASHFDRIWQQPNVWPPERWSMTEAVWNNVNTCLCESITQEDFLNSVGYPACELDTVDSFIDQLQASCAAISSTAQIHANIEWVAGLEAHQGHGRVLDYMNSSGDLAHDFGRFPDRMWYEDAGFGRRCALDPDPVFRAQYDAVHDFIIANRQRHGFPAPTPP